MLCRGVELGRNFLFFFVFDVGFKDVGKHRGGGRRRFDRGISSGTKSWRGECFKWDGIERFLKVKYKTGTVEMFLSCWCFGTKLILTMFGSDLSSVMVFFWIVWALFGWKYLLERIERGECEIE